MGVGGQETDRQTDGGPKIGGCHRGRPPLSHFLQGVDELTARQVGEEGVRLELTWGLWSPYSWKRKHLALRGLACQPRQRAATASEAPPNLS